MTLVSRRALLGSGGCGIVAMTTPSLRALSTRPLSVLTRLQKGDRVGIVAPAGFISDASELSLIEDTVPAMDLEPLFAANILSRHGYLAGTDKERAASLNAMFTDPSINAMIGTEQRLHRAADTLARRTGHAVNDVQLTTRSRSFRLQI